MTREALALVVFVGLLGMAGCPSTAAPCSAQDSVMLSHAVECKARVELECADVPDDKCPVIKECDAWGEARCGLGRAGAIGSGGSAGAK